MNQNQSITQNTATQKEQKKVIYDFGSNNGDDIPYYLKKSDIVIAVEANPVLCEQIQNRFIVEIREGRLFVESCVLNTDDSASEVYFYVHKNDHVLSQFPEPVNADCFEKVLLPSKSVLQLISKYGSPHYIKIDIEHYDEAILRVLFDNNIRPPFISAESHSIEVFSLLVCLGKYNSFKLVDGRSVSQKYNNHRIKVGDKFESYSFPYHSAGPFGDDICGKWISADELFLLLVIEGLGWKDIHATNTVEANIQVQAQSSKRRVAEMVVRYFIKPNMPKLAWTLIQKICAKLFKTDS
jgi:FkbM family methyltransferase